VHLHASTVVLQLNKHKTFLQTEAGIFSCKSTSRSDKNKYLWTQPSLISTSCIYTNTPCPQRVASAFCPAEPPLPFLPSDPMATGWSVGPQLPRDSGQLVPRGCPAAVPSERGREGCERSLHALKPQGRALLYSTSHRHTCSSPRGQSFCHQAQCRLDQAHSLFLAASCFHNHFAKATEGGDLARSTGDSPEHPC